MFSLSCYCGYLVPFRPNRNMTEISYSLAAESCIYSLTTDVGTKFRRQVTVAQSVQFACGLRATEFVFVCILFNVSQSGQSAVTCGWLHLCGLRSEADTLTGLK
jgi:hypothetical protein